MVFDIYYSVMILIEVKCMDSYCIHGTFGSELNLVLYRFWLQSLILMHANTNYNQVYCEY